MTQAVQLRAGIGADSRVCFLEGASDFRVESECACDSGRLCVAGQGR